MRWCLFITNFFILLTLGLELCCGCGAAGVKDASHLVCVLADDDAELKQGLAHENAFSDYDPPAMPGWHGVLWLATADWVAPLKGTEKGTVHTGIRRHRGLCQERC